MYATSANDSALTKRVLIGMGYMVLHAGGKKYVCYPDGKRHEYYASKKWIKHKLTISNTKAIGKLRGKSYATLGWDISGPNVIMTRSGVAEWTGIAK